MHTLVVNCGSSSLKYAIFDTQTEQSLLTGKVERLGQSGDEKQRTHQVAVAEMLADIGQRGAEFDLSSVGHRVVHGGTRYNTAVIIDEAVCAEIQARIPDAPMHNPYALAAIQAAMTALPDIPHVAVFDTAFHADMPRRARTYAIDYDVAQQHGIRRFGFHGISHAYVADKAAGFLQRPLKDLRLITLHLGNGASACAVEYGHSVETSMGNTPLEGLVMGSRSGDVDAGVLLTLLRSGDFDVEQLDDLLNQHSGLAGLSGLGNDLREIEDQAASGNDRARLAINVFAHRARKYIGAYAAAMGGVDAVVFTGGIGENSATMRRRILQRLEFLGLVIDEDRNQDALVAADQDYALLTSKRSRVEAIVVKTNEELMIARECATLVGSLHKDTAQALANASIPIAVSGRHAHLTAETFAQLFGPDATLTHHKDLSQPGQFAAQEKIDLIGPRSTITGVRILGPLRSVDQIEISRSDEFKLGIDAPVRDSGQVAGSAPVTVKGPHATVQLAEGLICARRHVHMHPDDATRFQVQDRQEVAIAVRGGARDLVFGDVLIRVKESYKLEMHIDTDEANAAELGSVATGSSGELIYTDVDDAYAELTTPAQRVKHND